MKAVWTIVALLLLGGLVVLLQPPASGIRGELAAGPELPGLAPRQSTVADSHATSDARPPADVPVEEPILVKETVPEPASAPIPEPEPGPTGSAPAEVAAVEAAASVPDATPRPTGGAEFRPEIPTIPEAELLPSRFVRLPDGAISIDDAWTVRGAGTADEPYEVSWEFLSSAQEDYMPRLGEKKLPARIAFLSGKRVKIAGFLAFPLVAPTSSECLLMLNQWDGCCIGIPPTPYDAVEVKLAAQIKGWKRHTINFGSIEGTFKVEPYLVENWLVGLYLIEGAKIDTEL